MDTNSFFAYSLEPQFPECLRLIKPIPDRVEAIGRLAPVLVSMPMRSVAIVGSRTASVEACSFARTLAFELAQAGYIIVSGGAFGIDIAAHQGCLDANGATIAVLAGGVDVYEPKAHANLFAMMLNQGALVSIRPRGTCARRSYYLQRNAVIAALVTDVVLVSCGVQSGARSTMAHARRLRRNVWVVPGSPWDSLHAGCALELQLGAKPLLSSKCILGTTHRVRPPLASHEPLSEQFPRSGFTLLPNEDAPLVKNVAESSNGLSRNTADFAFAEVPKKLIDSIAEHPKSMDQLHADTGIFIDELAAMLLTLTCRGLLRESPVGVFALVDTSKHPRKPDSR